MTQPDFEHIDELLQDEKNADADDVLYVQLMESAPKANKDFVQSLEKQLIFTKQRKRVFRIPKALRYLVAILIVSLLIIGTVFAVNSLFSQLIASDAGLSAVYEEGKGSELNLSTEIEQFTVGIQWGYADSQRVSLGYAISANDNQYEYTNLQLVDSVLTLDNGVEIPLNPVGLQFIENNRAVGTIEANLSTVELSDELQGTVSFLVGYAHNDYRTEVPLNFGGTHNRLEDWLLQTPLLTFEINLSVRHGYTVQLDLTDESAGIEMNLREFSVAPSRGYATVCFTLPEHPIDEGWSWSILNAQLMFNGEQVLEWASGRYEDGCVDIQLIEGLPLETGTWTLTILWLDGTRTRLPDISEIEATIIAIGGEVHEMEGSLQGLSLPEGAPEALGWKERIKGEWIFTFVAP